MKTKLDDNQMREIRGGHFINFDVPKTVTLPPTPPPPDPPPAW